MLTAKRCAGLKSMKQKMENMISTAREKMRRTGFIKKAVGLVLAALMILEAPSWSGLIELALAHEDKAGSGRCIYVDTSLIGADSDVMESGIGAYLYDREGNAYSDAPILMEKVDGKRNIYQLVLDDYYTYVEFTKGTDLNTSTKTGQLAIDWSLGAPCYMFNSEDLSDGGRFYGLYTIYFDLNGASGAFADNGIGIYAYNSSNDDSYTAVPVAMRSSDKGEGVYEYSFDKPYECIAFMGGYGSWNYEVATTPVYMEWNYSAPCFFLEQVNGFESTGIWRNLRYVVYFDASDIKDDEAFIENGVYLYAFNDEDDKLSENPVKMVASSVGEYIYEYTMETPYENLQFILGDSLEAEVASEVLTNDWLEYAEPCYKMTLDRKEIVKASPSMTPSASPSGSPSTTPSMTPSVSPSGSPSTTPSTTPSGSPSGSPSTTPSTTPSGSPSATPSIRPSATPSSKPSTSPSATPGATPSANPSATPSAGPTQAPTEAPTQAPTEMPTIEPTEAPTAEPTAEPTQEPAPEPVETPEPEPEPTPEPEENVTDEPSQDSGNTDEESGGSEDSSDSEVQVTEQARIISIKVPAILEDLAVVRGSYEMTWVGTEPDAGDDEVDTIENDNTDDSSNTDDSDLGDTEEPKVPDNPPTAEDPVIPDEQPEAPAEPTNVPNENPTSAPSGDEEPTAVPDAGDGTDETPNPSGEPGMADASPSATPEGTEEEPVVETTMSLLSSTGATIVLQRAGALPSRTGDVKIFFDTSGNGSWVTGDAYGWNKEDSMFVHFYNDNNEVLPSSNLARMTKTDLPAREADGAIWEYTLTKEQAEKYQYVIFQRYQSAWNSDNQQTIADKVTNLIPKDMSRPCFVLTKENNTNPAKKTGVWYDLGPLSQNGEEIYFFDMTSQYDAENIEVHFAGNGNTDEIGKKNPATGGYIIPSDTLAGPYSTVAFYDKTTGLQIGETYNFFDNPDVEKNEKGFLYQKDETNTFYYGITEKTDGTMISTWGARPSEPPVSLANRKLYFDKLYFKVTKTTAAAVAMDGEDGADSINAMSSIDGIDAEAANIGAQFQIGTEVPVALTADENDKRTYSYVFDAATTATSQTILTYLDQDGTKYHFFWDKFDLDENGTIIADGNNLVTQEYEVAKVMGQYRKGNTIYFDATYSKLSYNKSDGAKNDGKGIPASDTAPVYYLATGPGMQTLSDVMVKAEKESWKDVWRVDLPEGYTQIKFLAYANETNPNVQNGNAEATKLMDIPTDIDDPCFYADDGDSVIYDGGMRGGYWADVYKIRDAEKYKETDIVDIKSGTLTRASDVFYADCTFYDYYSDYELNGNNRDNYGGGNTNNHRYWVTFRQFDQALSDYYEEKSAGVPIYTGHFQWSGWNYYAFDTMNETLKLYGFDNKNYFYSTNNSAINASGEKDRYHAAAQGLVSDTLSDGNVLIKGGTGLLPHFDADFLAGNNSKNAVLGEVYENVAFPFRAIDRDHNGIKYWTFDSKDTTLAMRQDSSTGQYYLQDTGNQGWSKNGNSTGTPDGKDGVSTTYGFFPFNETSAHASGKNYNYGFGTKLEFKFRLTKDGTVLDMHGDPVPITFEFAGDDDVWVFIDGKLALDVGGAHARVTGRLNFQNKTAWVSDTKTSAGSNSRGEITTPFEMIGGNTDEHTLTMFYMERGMWESNMAVSFNFPDENQLAVEKEVDVSGVDAAFQGLFEGVSLFSFAIRNQATHYGPHEVETTAESIEKVFNDSFAGTIDKDSTANIFEAVGSYAGRDGVVHWKAKYDEPGGGYRDKRCGIIYPAGGGTMDLTDANRYLQFKVYYDNNGNPAINHMYIELVDNTGHKISHTLNGMTYGTVNIKRREWTTITVDLQKFAAGATFNWAGVSAVRFGYNYERDIYLDDFIFKSTTGATALTGFITKQYDIPDYGSATSGNLEVPKGALYTLTTTDGNASYGVIGSDGQFALGDGENVLFRDQFRRGSYIELREMVDSDVFATSWTMYENGQPVTSMGSGNKVQNGSIGNLSGKTTEDNFVDDGRTEIYSGSNDAEGVYQGNSGYTSTHRPGDNPVFVFRSYADPDTDSGMTKLRVLYTNTVKTGALTIRKERSERSDALTGTYRFDITFTNVAGMGLESDPIVKTITLKENEERTITGIPINTEFTITETPSDKSFIEDVKVIAGDNVTFDPETKAVAGQITPAASDVKLTFVNMLKPVINIRIEKLWQNADGTGVADDVLPEYLTIRLQRREKGSAGEWIDVIPSGQTTADIKIGNNQARTWEYEFKDLDKFVDNKADVKVLWEYRVVEVKEDGTVVANGGVWNNKFQATYSDPVYGDESLSADAEEVFDSTITNIHLVSLKVKKVDGSGKPLGGVSFQLQKKTDDGWMPIEVTVNGETTDTIITPSEDDNPVGGAGVIIFANLPSGEYQLVETATVPGHTLLASPIPVTISTKGELKYTINGIEQTPVDNTIEITIKNGQNLVMPPTGGSGPIPFTVGGLSICMFASLMYIDSMRKRRKEGKAS